MKPRAVCVVGHGKVGNSLARGFRSAGYDVQLLRGRALRRPRLRATTVILCVPDTAIADVATALSSHLPARAIVLHCAGARGPEALAACRPQARVAAFHPLASFADPRHPPRLDRITFVIDGDAAACAAAARLARALGARTARARLTDARYHAAAAMLANGAAALALASQQIFRELGFSEAAARHALGGLLGSVADNIGAVGVPRALTGPVARGDALTVARHIAALEKSSADQVATYTALLPAIVRCARAQGLSAAAARRVLAVQRQK